MKILFTALFVSIAFIISGCGSDQEDHSHGEEGDHTHEVPAQQPSEDDGEPVRIGGGEDSDEEESDHSHDEDSDHSHEDEHSLDDSTHSHGDEEHNH